MGFRLSLAGLKIAKVNQNPIVTNF